MKLSQFLSHPNRVSLKDFDTRKRHKYNVTSSREQRTYGGVVFDSLAERDKYIELINDPLTIWIDCHVAVSLPGGLRFKIDFIVWRRTFCKIHDRNDACCPAPEAIEVKGVATSDFKIKRKLFNEFHPLKPLSVIRRQGKRWVEV